MIKLEVEEYCDDCPEFDAHVEKEVPVSYTHLRAHET